MSIQNLLNGFLTIKDFSELVGITVKSLRNYDKKGIFHPANMRLRERTCSDMVRVRIYRIV